MLPSLVRVKASWSVVLVSGFLVAGCGVESPQDLSDVTALVDHMSDENWDAFTSDFANPQGVASNPRAKINVSTNVGVAPFNLALDAKASEPGAAEIVDYYWEFGDGAAAAGAEVSHTYDATGEYVARLTVTDAVGDSSFTEVRVVAAPEFAIESAPVDENAPDAGDYVFEAVSTEPDWVQPDDVDLVWTFSDGETATGQSVIRSFSTSTLCTVTLSVVLGTSSVSCTTQDVQLAVGDIKPSLVADAGPDLDVQVGDLVRLDGSNSYGSGTATLRYVWSQVSGPTVELSKDTSPMVLFVAPQVQTTTEATFRLEVSQGKLRASDTVVVRILPENIVNVPPTAAAGADLALFDTDGDGVVSVTLDASASSDSDGQIVDYAWRNAASGQILSEGADAVQTVQLPVGVYDLELTVTDDGAALASDVVRIEITAGALLTVTPTDDYIGEGVAGGPFSPSAKQYVLTNDGGAALDWMASSGVSWVSLSASAGRLEPGASVSVTASFNAASLAAGAYSTQLRFKNVTNSVGDTSRAVSLTVGGTVSPIQAPFAQPVVTLDGVVGSAEWSEASTLTFDAADTIAPGVVVDGAPASSSDAFAVVRAMHDGDYLYVAVIVADDNVVSNAANVWEADCVELFLDHDNSKTDYLGIDRLQFDVAANGGLAATPVVPTGSWDGAAGLISGGYAVEFRINKAALGLTEGAYGFDIAINDVEPAAGTVETRFWRCAVSEACEHESLWGSLVLGAAPGLMSVSSGDFSSSGDQGGPFSPASVTYTLTNSGGQGVDWAVGKTQSWVTLSKSGGYLASGASDTVVVTINANANSLATGSYSDVVTFVNETNGVGNTTRAVSLSVTAPQPAKLEVSSGDFGSSGAKGGPFNPASATYTLTNSGDDALTWSVSANVAWVTLSKASGALAAGASDTVVVTIDSDANALDVGSYNGVVSFVNATNHSGDASRAVALNVLAVTADTMTTANRTSGIAPLLVHFDAVNTTAPVVWNSGVQQPTDNDFAAFHYEWTFGDDADAKWSTNNKSKNTACGAIAAHLYEKPGTYTATLKITDASGQVHEYRQTITVEAFSGTTYYVSASSGSDTNNGLSPAAPFKTLDKGFAMLGQNVRVLFKRGDTWTTDHTMRISVAGPMIIGAYYNADGSDNAAQPRPVFQQTAGGDMLTFHNSYYVDCRVMDLEFLGSNKQGSAIAAGGSENNMRGVVFVRLKLHNFWLGYTLTYAEKDHYDLGMIECTQRDMAGYSGFVGGRRLAFLGNDVTGMGQHALRLWHCPKSVVSSNIYHTDGGGHALKLHNQQNLDLPDTAYVVVSDNDFKCGNYPMTVMIAPQNTEAYEVVRDVVFERNIIRSNSQQQIAMVVAGPNNIVRNNLIDLTGSSVYCRAVQIQTYDVAPAPTGFRMYNNTIYRGDNGQEFSALKLYNAANLAPVLRNNLVSAPNFTGYTKTLVENGDSSVVNENNILTDSAGFVSASGGDFHLQQSSVAVGAGKVLPQIRDDYDCNARPSATAPDVGAFQR